MHSYENLAGTKLFSVQYIFLLIVIVIIGCTPEHHYVGRAVQMPEHNASDIAQDNKAEFNGVSFSFAESLDTIVIPEEKLAVSLGKATDKPDSVAPKHTSFRFEGEYRKNFESSFFSAELRIYSIKDCRKQLAISKDALTAFDSQLSDLQKMLGNKAALPVQGEFPFVKYIDAEQAFHAHTKYIDFRNGRGLFFLTQYNIEPTLINNKGLTYIFQGLSNDGEYYILGTFPVSASFLPKDNDTTKIADYELPLRSFSESDQSRYENYISTVHSKLEDLPSGGFKPSLTEFERIASSLKIDR